MVRNKKHESAAAQKDVAKVPAKAEDQPTVSGGHAYADPKEGVQVKPPGSGTYHDPQEGVEPKAPGVGVYCDERANALSCVTPATPKAAPVLAKSELKETDRLPQTVAESSAKSEPTTAPSKSETKE